jgi:hypothetical protein
MGCPLFFALISQGVCAYPENVPYAKQPTWANLGYNLIRIENLLQQGENIAHSIVRIRVGLSARSKKVHHWGAPSFTA